MLYWVDAHSGHVQFTQPLRGEKLGCRRKGFLKISLLCKWVDCLYPMVLRISWLLYTYRLMGRIDIVSTPRMTTWCLLDLIYVLYKFFMHISHLKILYASSCSLVLTAFCDRQGSLTWLASVLPSGSPKNEKNTLGGGWTSARKDGPCWWLFLNPGSLFFS